MKIAYLINQYPAISHSFIRREIQALERQGLSVARYAIRPAGYGISSAEDDEEAAQTRYIVSGRKGEIIYSLLATVARRPVASLKAFGATLKMGARSEAGLVRHLFYWAEALVVAHWCRADGITHLHAHFGTNSATVAMLAAMLDEERTFSVTVHGPEEFDKPGLISLPEKIKSAAFVAGVSSFGVSQLRRHADFDDWDKLAQVHCGIERSFWEGAPAKQFGSKTFVSVGRLAEQKGQMTLVRACGLLKERGRTFSLRLVGDGELRGPLEAAITDLGLKDSVQILGWKTPTQVREEILKARAFVLPSYAEGLPVSIMEAFSLNTPVISSYVAGIPELVRPGENGWLAPAADEEALADAMADCLDASEQKLAEMGRAGKARTLERHDMDTIAAQLARLFRPYAAPTDSAPEKPIPNADQRSVEEEAA